MEYELSPSSSSLKDGLTFEEDVEAFDTEDGVRLCWKFNLEGVRGLVDVDDEDTEVEGLS